MQAEKTVGALLDIITSPSAEGPEALEPKVVRTLRNTIKHRNIVALGVAHKVVAGKTQNDFSLTYYVIKKRAIADLSPNEVVPATIATGGKEIPTDVVELGELLPQPTGHKPNVRRKPIGPGYSVGHFSGDTGTLGAIVTRDRKTFLLSNSHVLAMCGKAKKGDPILFPGVDDGGKKTTDTVATLFDFTTIKARGVNSVDTAIAVIDAAHMLQVHAAILGIGHVTGTTKAKIGMEVEKVGRTSGLTKGTVVSNKFRPLRMPYPDVGEVSFDDQILISKFTEPGDSGSLVVDSKSKKAIGLHFAGANGGSVSAPIDRVLSAMKAKLAKKAT